MFAAFRGTTTARPFLKRFPVIRTASSTSTAVKQSPLKSIHEAHHPKWATFAGWRLPMVYEGQTHLESHAWTRTRASLFDVSHMFQFRLEGLHHREFLQRLVVANVFTLEPGQSQYTLFTNAQGGIIDDAILTGQSEAIDVVSNAACAEKVHAHLLAQLEESSRAGEKVELKIDSAALLAIQGPRASEVLASFIPAVRSMPFMTSINTKVYGRACKIQRSGYTGEDGFEMSIPRGDHVLEFAQGLLDHPDLRWAGLAARDSLRLEAGLCLYGHDLDDTTSPVEANLLWTLPKNKRTSGGYLGHEIIATQLKNGVARKRVGLVLKGAPAREGSVIMHPEEELAIGNVTSGSPSPTLGAPTCIAMGYVSTACSKVGTQVRVKVRGKLHEAQIVKMPFVPTRYYRGE